MAVLFLAALYAFNLKPAETPVAPPAAASYTDGPYVFYHADSLEVLYSGGPDTLPNLYTRKVAYRDTAGLVLSCRTESGRDSFQFRLWPARVKPAQYDPADRTLVVSDIEGNFYALKKLLLANGVMDDRYRWRFGAGRLTLVGDFVDRGRDVTAVLWLIYKLEADAAAAGGDVRFVLGNHEEMMLRGDARYAQRKYRMIATRRGSIYAALWGDNTELGRWLRSKNAVERSGRDLLFVHGGVSQSSPNSASKPSTTASGNISAFRRENSTASAAIPLFFSATTAPCGIGASSSPPRKPPPPPAPKLTRPPPLFACAAS
jgi:Calcineurin-like phosphoesterase